MQKAKYTPGPWKITLNSVVTRLFGKEGIGGDSELIAELRFFSSNRANGRLIEAAPELLDALDNAPIPRLGEELEDFIKRYKFWFCQSRHDALAKARAI
jgi:hypothetical protein